MKTVKAIHIAPVKSLGLEQPQTVHVGPAGILEDRRFHLISDQNRLLTQREIGCMVQLKTEYRIDPEWLCLRFPDGTRLEGPPELGEPIVTQLWGRHVLSHVLAEDWNDVLSDFCGQPVRLVRSDEPCQSYDEYPVSLVSQASVQELGRRANGQMTFDSRRFRPNLLLDGCEPHDEDTWIGGAIQIGEELRLRVVARDPRCAITTHDPQTGERDIDTLRLILSYRPNPRAAYFGVYGIVERPGTVSIGDVVTMAM